MHVMIIGHSLLVGEDRGKHAELCKQQHCTGWQRRDAGGVAWQCIMYGMALA